MSVSMLITIARLVLPGRRRVATSGGSACPRRPDAVVLHEEGYRSA
jgi:hypothetical protein